MSGAVSVPRSGWIGPDHVGRVEALGDEEWVITECFSVIVPVWPRRSYYVHHDDDGDECWTEIPLHRTSVLAGLLRTSAWMIALGCGLGALFGSRAPIWTGPVAIVAALIAAWATWSLGRLSTEERERRALLRRVVGVGAPPELLPPKQAWAVRQQLDSAWTGRQSGSWQDAVVAGVADELLVALAEYHQRDALAARARSNLNTTSGVWN